jgi:hypothetical protein
MSTATTAVTICSNASLMLGGKAISSLDENNDRTRLASNLFEPVRDYVLRRHPWNCATKRAALAPDVVAIQPFDWAFQFTLPSDFLKVQSVGRDFCITPHKIESGKLLSDENPCYLVYTWRNENPGTWDPMLVWGMTMSMKAVMAYPITGSTSLEQLVEEALKDVLRQARAVDGQDDPPETLGDTPLINSRFGNGFGWRR